MKDLKEARNLKNHHSTIDWDFSEVRWELSSTQYVSPPTSLACTAGVKTFILCRLANSLCLPQGRMVFCVYPGAYDMPLMSFRNQAPLGSSSYENCYSIYYIDNTRIRLAFYLDGVRNNLPWWDINMPGLAWHKLRVTWWNGVDPTNTPALCVELEREEDGEWVSYGILYDTENRWAESEVNRCGPAFISVGSYHDDTEIWIPT